MDFYPHAHQLHQRCGRELGATLLVLLWARNQFGAFSDIETGDARRKLWDAIKDSLRELANSSGFDFYRTGQAVKGSDLSPKFPPVLGRVRLLMFGPMRPAFPVPFGRRTRWG